MRAALILTGTALLLGACSGDSGAPPAADTSGGAPAASAPAASAPASSGSTGGTASTSAPPAAPMAPGSGGMPGRTAELLNPDNNAMVFLYYDLTGNPPPIDNWVQNDGRVRMAPALDKPATRDMVRAEFESGIAAVRNVGTIRISLNSANLSDYDPTYGEFTIRALSPSSEIPFDALGQKVAIKFANARTAQVWKVTPEEAQKIRDRIGAGMGYYNVEIELLLRIKSVQPGPGGGTIITDVLEYEMRDRPSGTILVRAQPAT